MSWPGYSSEYTSGAIDVMQKFLIPDLRPILESTPEPDAVRSAMESQQGHPMAKAALSTALLDLWLKERNQSLGSYLGAVRERVDCGVSVGIATSLDALLEEVGLYVDQGYRRIKLKIEPGWDLEPVRLVRETWPKIPLQVDANQAYGRSDGAHLAQLDACELILIEQPLPEDDLLGHALISRL
jgi:O-succinylbenzoate synthase